jgi:hypothetical protein
MSFSSYFDLLLRSRASSGTRTTVAQTMTYRVRVTVQYIPLSFLIIKKFCALFTASTFSKSDIEVNHAKTQPNSHVIQSTYLGRRHQDRSVWGTTAQCTVIG